MKRIPAGQEERSSSPVMSATHAPSRACSSARKPGWQALAGIFRIAACTSSVMGHAGRVEAAATGRSVSPGIRECSRRSWPHEHPAPQVPRRLRQGEPGELNVVGRRIGPRRPVPQHDGEGFAVPARPGEPARV
jgi:hypothetical protein